MSTVEKSQLTSLFDNTVLNRVERMRLNPRRRLTNRSRGEHLAGKGGSSTDFADYRDYAAGDDIRYVDWNIFARLQKPYIKQFLHEEELHVVLLVDGSSSMLFDNKLMRAKQLAASFGIMGLLNGERVSVFVGHERDDQPAMLPPAGGRQKIRPLLTFLEGIEGGGATPVEEAIDTMLRFHRGRGIVVVLSDFLTFSDLSRSFNMLFSSGLEIWGLQIFGESEVNPDVQGDLRFVDCETGGSLDVTNAGELLDIYHAQRQALHEVLDGQCRRRNGRFQATDTSESLEALLFDRLCRYGWVRR